MINPIYKKDIISAEQFSRRDLEYILSLTASMKKMVESEGGNSLLRGRILTALFYEPSSRTFGSFVAAMQRLGGGFVPLHGMGFSSVTKGETLPDTIRTFASYSDAIVLRHSDVGSAKLAAEFSDVPILNAGDGIGEHPTQAPQDIFTMQQMLGSLKNMHIVFVGDLAHYRNVNSLVKALLLFPKITMTFVSPKEVQIQPQLREYIKRHKAKIHEVEDLNHVVGDADVLYVTRVKKEYMSEELYKKIKDKYVIDRNILKKMKKKSIIMHPLPRVGEIAVEVDLDQRAVYFREQMRNGMYTRMALLASVLLKEVK
ncbi:aspartate carbamoyltransferase [Candidatus Microgenomates bacterium]|nr:MAG: aspartate carbamoyltransferase [Candidatus Microgenomates bacterium]